ncbi:GNAT family N-acetyltransferase [Mesorhizobium sp. M0320]|uniref:GNAT family N-acetyltransferase n=1 Tax=Mesorhizobium sp. M0320 TaxID=2956936 RepID=UPI00333B5E24
MSATEFRDLSGMAEFRAAVALQVAVWGEGDTPDPAELMMVIQAEGGLAAGAFVGDRLIAYVFGSPSATPCVQHSHRLAVLSEARGRGLGVALKWYQRRWCLTRGIRHVRWTFDPMRTVNAALNIARLGGRSASYLVDYFGVMGGINEGLPSDRLLVDWFLDDPVVVAKSESRFVAEEAKDSLRIRLHDDVETLIRDDRKKALQARLALRDGLRDAFAGGYEISGYDRLERAYILTSKGANDEDRSHCRASETPADSKR